MYFLNHPLVVLLLFNYFQLAQNQKQTSFLKTRQLDINPINNEQLNVRAENLFFLEILTNIDFSSDPQDFQIGLKVTNDLSYGFILTTMGSLFVYDIANILKLNQSNPLLLNNSNYLLQYQPIHDFNLLKSDTQMVVISDNYVIKLNILKNYPYIIMDKFYQNSRNLTMRMTCLSHDQSILFIEIEKGIIIFDLSLNNFTQEYTNRTYLPYNNDDMKITMDQKFLFLSIKNVGFRILDVSNINKIQAALLNYNEKEYDSYEIAIDSKRKVLYESTYFKSILKYDYSDLYINMPGNIKVIDNQDVYQSINGILQKIVISQDFETLVVYGQSFGFYVADIQNPQRNELNQIIIYRSFCRSFQISQNKQNLFALFSDQIVIYTNILLEKEESPHFLNFHKIQAYESTNHTINPYKLQFNETQKKLYVAAQEYFMILEYSNNPNIYQLKYKLTLLLELPVSWFTSNVNAFVANFYIMRQNPNIIIILLGTEGFASVNIENYSNPIKIQQTNLQGICQQSYQMAKQPSILLVICQNYGLYIFNIDDLATNPTLLISYPINLIYKIRGIQMVRNETLLITSVQYEGIYLFDFTDLLNPIRCDFLPGNLIQTFRISNIHPNIAYLVEGNDGLSIIDYSNITNIKRIQSKLFSQIAGWAHLLNVNKDETLLFIGQQLANCLMLIDISDINNPKLLQKFNQDLKIISIQIAFDSSIIFLGFQGGLYVFPLHSDFKYVKNYLLNENRVSSNQIFQTGQKAQINLQIVSQPHLKTIKQVYLLRNGLLYSLPSIFEVNNDSFDGSSVFIQVVFDNDYLGVVEIIYFSFIKIEQNEFRDDWAKTGYDNDKATKIYNQLIYSNFIDSNGYPTNTESFYMDLKKYKLYFNEYDQDTIKFIQKTILQKIDYFLLKIKVQTSLFFNASGNSEKKYITTLSDKDLMITLQINETYGLFPNLDQFNNLIVTISESKDQLTLEGKLSNLNEQLDLIVYKNNQNFSWPDIKVNITIDDRFNTIQRLIMNMSQLLFIQQYIGITINKNIQENFNNLHPEGKIALTQAFSFILPKDAFVSYKNYLPIQYKVYILKDGQFENIDFDLFFWLQLNQDAGSYIIHGTPGQDLFNQIYTIKVIGYEGQTQNEQQFTLQISILPISLIIQYLVLVGSPLVTILGLIKYRQYVYNLICKKKYQRSMDVIYISADKEYKKFIPVIKNDRQTCYQLMDELKKNKSFKIQDFIDSNGDLNYSEYVNFFQKTNLKQWVKPLLPKIIDKNTNIFRILSLIFIYEYHQQSKLLSQLYLIFKKQNNYLVNNDWYKEYVDISYEFLDYNQLMEGQGILPQINFKLELLHYKIKKILKQDMSIKPQYSIDFQFQQMYPTVQFQTICRCIEADALGITKLENYQFSRGESIIAEISNLAQVSSYKKVNYESCVSLRSFFDLDMQVTGIKENRKLPQWLTCEMKQNLIIIRGIPKIQDIDIQNFYIRITSVSGIIFWQYQIIIKDTQDVLQTDSDQYLLYQTNRNNEKNDDSIQVINISQNLSLEKYQNNDSL